MNSFEDHLSEGDQRFYKSLHIGEDLSTPMSKHASKVFKLGVMLAESEINLDRFKSKMDTIEKQLMKSYRNADKNNQVKSTESQLSERAQTHTMYLDAQEHFFEAKKLHLVVKAKYKSQLEKGTMLQQLAQHRRKELDAGIRSTLRKSE
jgi:hypothetical protein